MLLSSSLLSTNQVSITVEGNIQNEGEIWVVVQLQAAPGSYCNANDFNTSNMYTYGTSYILCTTIGYVVNARGTRLTRYRKDLVGFEMTAESWRAFVHFLFCSSSRVPFIILGVGNERSLNGPFNLR
jgi:hypothetical protein